MSSEHNQANLEEIKPETTGVNEAIMDLSSHEHWDEFIKFVVEEVRPDWLPDSYKLDEETKKLITDHLESGEIEQLRQHFDAFVYAGQISPEVGNDFGDLPSDWEFQNDEVIPEDDFLAKLESEFQPDEGSLLDQMSENPEGGPGQDDFDYTGIETPSDFKLPKDDDFSGSPSFAPDSQNGEAFQQQTGKVEHVHEPSVQVMAQGPRTEPQLVHEGPSAVNALGHMLNSLVRSSAHIASGIEGITSPLASWGSNKSKQIMSKLSESATAVNEAVSEIANQTPAEAHQANQSFREAQLETSMGSIANVMEQARSQMREWAQPAQNNQLSLIEMKAESDKSDNPKVAAFFNDQIKDQILEMGIDSIIEAADSVVHANQLIGNYVNRGKAIADRIGEDFESALGNEMSAYQNEVQEYSSIVSEMIEKVAELDVANEEEKAMMGDALDRLKDSVEALVEMVKSLFQKNSGISAGM